MMHSGAYRGRQQECPSCGGWMDDAGMSGYICQTPGCVHAWGPSEPSPAPPAPSPASDPDEPVDQIIEGMKCYNCKAPTDRLILFSTSIGLIEASECLDCRQSRVQEQVDAGLRPASDLLPENLPEIRNPL